MIAADVLRRSTGAAKVPAGYPMELVGSWHTADGIPLVIRPIHPDDEPLLVRFHEGLSPETVHARYFGYLKLSERAAHPRLDRIVHIDYGRVMVLIAERIDPFGGEHDIVGIGRLVEDECGIEAEFAVLVADGWQRRGIGTELVRRLVSWGRSRGLRGVSGEILGSNAGMLRVCRRLGFALRDGGCGAVRAVLDLAGPADALAG